MRTLVIGAGGFIGGALACFLDRQGHEVWRIVGSGAPHADASTIVYSAGIYATLARELDRTELVVYAAGRVLPRSETSVSEAYDVDCRPFAELLSALSRKANPTTLLLMSSGGAVYGFGSDCPLDEDSPLRPSSPYGLSRVFMEQALMFHARSSAIHPVILRMSNVYGPGQRADGGSAFILRALRAAAGEEPLPLWGSGSQTKDFIYVDDVLACVGALIRSGSSVFPAPVFNVCSGHSHSLLEVIDSVERVTGRPVPVVRVTGVGGDVPIVRLTAGKAKALLGWRAALSLEEGIAKYWKVLREAASLRNGPPQQLSA